MRKVLAATLVCLLLIVALGCDSKDALMQLIIDKQYADARIMAGRMYESNPADRTAWLVIIDEHEGEDYIPRIEFQSGLKWDVSDYLDTVKGRIKNTGERTIAYIEITAKFLDTQGGNVIDSDWTNIAQDIGPGEQCSFEILHRRASGYKNVQLTVTKVRLK